MSSIPRTSRVVFVNRNTCLFNYRIAINNSLLSCPDDPDPGFSLVASRWQTVEPSSVHFLTHGRQGESVAITDLVESGGTVGAARRRAGPGAGAGTGPGAAERVDRGSAGGGG
ncbi:uncharacterized protein AFUA_4G02850 [Aspergillus fumigatus Af293]|uniref:Uncharacterized protein n=1 Tax=Aspergillus fumigatus (strain ATCC MYA-4609 / CBS 101355 / FGSC A1100 / Af293) TaxID=330879 RepID=Q4WA30_ASPFU|nr:hypothetical protein AFUA_4G02850 [Aspergillus fumigatus Af293]EAL84433.1 hypothetical protein AFUA_4G02850 [Aspergillus fumigatus Af293]